MFPVIRAPPNQSVCLGSVAIALLHDPPPPPSLLSSPLKTTLLPYSSPQTERQCDACKREEGDGDAHFVSSDRGRASEPNFLLSVRMRKGKQASRDGEGERRGGDDAFVILMEDWGGRKSYPTGTVHPRLQEMFRLHEIHYRICLAYFFPLQK